MKMKKPVRAVMPRDIDADALMDTQDTKAKGDSTHPRKKDKVITFWVTEQRRNEIKAYAAAHDMTVARLIQEALEIRMSI